MADENPTSIAAIAAALSEISSKLEGVATRADLAQLRLELATKADLAEAVTSINDTLAVYAAAVNALTTMSQAFAVSRDRLARRLDAHARRISDLEAPRREG